MPLYKYTRAANARFLAKCSLCFSPASKFNDPFDGLPDTAALMSMPNYKALKKHFEDIASVNPKDAQLAAGAAMTGQLIEKISKNGMIDRFLKDLDQNFRILCLSRAAPESAGAALMFGHYAENHTGFAYEFDDANPWFGEHNMKVNAYRDIDDVNYRGHRAHVLNDGRKGLFVKSDLWSYEQEVRLVRYIGNGANGLIDKDRTIAEFPPNMLTAILVGCLAQQSTIDELRVELASRGDLSHVKLHQMVRHPDTFQFVREEIA